MFNRYSLYLKLSFIIVVVFFIYGCLYLIFGEQVPKSINKGFGWDGIFYGEAAGDFANIIVNRSINSFHLQRIFPSAVVYLALKISGASLNDPENIIIGFGIYNFVIVLFSILLFYKIIKKAGLSDAHLLLGLISFVFCFPIFKLNFYYPVLTDATAFCIGMTSLWAYFHKNNYVLFLSALLGAFTWPIILFAIPLLCVFRPNGTIPVNKKRINVLLSIGLMLLISIVALLVQIKYRHGMVALAHPLSLDFWLLLGGVITFSAFVFFVFRFLLSINIINSVKQVVKFIEWKWVLIFSILIIGVKFFAATFEPPEGVGFKGYIIRIISFASCWPSYPLISHIIYYGPIFFLLIFFWKKIMNVVQEGGFGLLAFFIINLIQVFDPESRHIIFFFPFLIYYLLIAIKDFNITGKFLLLFTIIALIGSKGWLQINTSGYLKNVGYTIVYTEESYAKIDFSAIQTYFMNFGTFMTFNSYWMQCLVIIPCGVLLYFVYNYNKSKCKNCL